MDIKKQENSQLVHKLALFSFSLIMFSLKKKKVREFQGSVEKAKETH